MTSRVAQAGNILDEAPVTKLYDATPPARLIAEPERWGILPQHFWGFVI